MQLLFRVPQFRDLLFAVQLPATPTSGSTAVLQELILIARTFCAEPDAILNLSGLIGTLCSVETWNFLFTRNTGVILRDAMGSPFHPYHQQCASEGYMCILTEVDKGLQQLSDREVLLQQLWLEISHSAGYGS